MKSSLHTALLAALLLAAAGAASASATPAEPERSATVTIHGVVIAAGVDAAADEVVLTVDRGTRHGVSAGARASVHGLDDEGDPGAIVARATVAEAAGEEASIRLPRGAAEAIAPGALVVLDARVPEDAFRGLLFDIAALRVTFTDNAARPLVDLAALALATDDGAERAALDAMVAAGREVVPYAEGYTDALPPGGRFAGARLADALGRSTPDDYRRFLRYVREFPVRYAGRTWRISETYATWLVHGEPPGSDDLWEALSTLRGAALTDRARVTPAGSLVALARRERARLAAWPAGRLAEARRRLATLRRAADALQPVPDALEGELLAIEAALLSTGSGRPQVVADTWRRAGDRLAAAGELLRALEAFDEAAWGLRAAGDLPAAEALAERVRAGVEAARPEADLATRPTLLAREASAVRLLGRVGVQQGRRPATEPLWSRLAELAEERGHAGELAEAALHLGELAAGRGEHPAAAAHLAQAARLFGETGGEVDEARALEGEAASLRALGDPGAARERLERALGIRERVGPPSALAHAQMELGNVLIGAQQAAAALPLFEAAASAYRKARLPIDEAFALHGAAFALMTLGRADESVAPAARALQRFERAGDPEGIAVGHLVLGQALRDARQVARARAAYEAILRVASSDALRGAAHEALAELALDLGALDEAERHAAEGLALTDQPGREVARLDLLLLRRRALMLRAEFEDAVAVGRECLALARSLDDPARTARVLRSLAWTLIDVGRLSEARAMIDEAMTLLGGVKDHVEEAWVLNALSRVHSAYGDFVAEEEALARAFERVEGSDAAAAAAAIRFNRALNLIGRRDFARALAEITAAAEQAGTAVIPDVEVAMLHAKGQVLTKLGRYEEAATPLRRALELARERAPHRAASVLRSLGELEAERGDSAAAEGVLREAAALEERQRGEAGIGSLAALGVFLARAGRAEEAVELLDRAIQRAQRRGGALPSEALYELGRIRAAAGASDAAIELLALAVREVERNEALLRDEADRARYYEDKLEIYRALVKLLLTEGRIEDALEYVERARLAELRDIDRRAGPQSPSAALMTELEVQEARLQRRLDDALSHATPDLATMARLDGLLVDVRRRRAAFLEQLDRDDALYDRYAIRPLSLEKLQQYLPEGTLVVAPVLLDDRVVVFAVTRDVLTHFTHAVSPEELDRRVRSFARDVHPDTADGARGHASLRRARAEAQALYDVLLRPAFEALGAPRTLVVSPMGPLRYVPFAALHDGERWVVERSAVISATSLDREKFTAASPRASAEATVLALVDPGGDLPGARVEALAIRGAMPEADVLEGAEATLAALRLKVRVPGFDIVHLAAHGRLDAVAPERSHIELAGEHLRYTDIPTLSPRRTSLVVLSACVSGVLTGGTGAEIAGLAYQFQRGDVHSVLATLWEVDDRATASLMERFYQGVREGRRYVDALAEAQRGMIADDALAHPAYWAAFFLMGSP